MKGVLLNVTACIALPSNGQHPGMTGAVNNGRANGGPALNRSHENGGGQSNLDPNDGSAEDLDATRSREIESKAATGIMLLLLKWLKISRMYGSRFCQLFVLTQVPDVLKFEYLTQLLLDSNYLPLVLKLFAHQDIQSVVDSKTDRLEHR